MTLSAVPEPLSRRRVGHMQVFTFSARSDMGEAAGEAIAAEIRARLQAQSELRMIFAAAPSQAEALTALVRAPGIEWGRITAFHMDEYIGLSTDAPERFSHWLDAHLFTLVPFRAVHRIMPEPEAEAAARDYAGKLDEAVIDIVVLGIGVNGHIAFNDPPVADFSDPLDVKIVTLDAECRQQQVDDKCFPSLADVPRQAITLTVPRLLRAEALFCVVPGAMKRDAVQQTLHGPISTACPASILREQAHCTLFLDRESDPDA